MKNKTKFKSRVKLIIIIIIAAILGAASSIASIKLKGKPISFSDAFYETTFIIMSIIGILSLLFSLYNCIKIKKQSKKDLNEVQYKELEKTVENAMILDALIIILNYILLAFTISTANSNKISVLYAIVPVIFLFSNIGLETVIYGVYNKLYPDKSIDIWDTDASQNLFKKLDEGEKWVVYQSSYKSFMVMESLFPICIILLTLASVLFKISFLPILIICILWAVHKLIYFKESRKYDD